MPARLQHLKRLFHQSKPRFRWLWSWIIRGRDFLRWIPVHKIPVSSKYFGRPKGFYKTTHEYLDSPAGRTGPAGHQGANSAREIYPAETLHFTLPTPIDGGPVHPNFLQNQIKEMPPSYVFQLAGARFWGHYGGSIITHDDRLLADLSHDVLGPTRHKIFTKFKLPPCRHLPGTVAVLSTAEAASNYWHWTFDLLPRLHLLEKAGFTPATVDYYLVNHTNLPFQLETLADFGIQPHQIIQTDSTSHFQTGRIVVASLKPSQLHVAKWACDFLHSLAPQSSTSTPKPPHRRLYISRENAAFRRLINEDEVFAILHQHGFEKIHCEKLTVREQRHLFNEAEIIVAPHGAALSNLVYCKPGTQVLELFSPNYVDLSIWPLASHRRLTQWYFISEASAQKDSNARTENISLNPSVLLILLKRLRTTIRNAVPSLMALSPAQDLRE